MEPTTLTQTDKAFYPTMGPFFVSAEVRQATGSPMTSTPDVRWTVIRAGRRVVAFAGLRLQKNGGGEFVAVYAVDGDAAAKGAAVEAALADARTQGLKTVKLLAKMENAQFYRDLGFVSGVLRGGFMALERAL
jgi:hypothetical protein